MANAAAFQATFSDWRLIKGRKVVQVVLELPIEQADHAYQVLGGMPDPGKSVWCAVARLKLGKEAMPTEDINPRPATRPVSETNAPGQAKERRAFATLPLPQQAAMLCARQAFQTFLREEHGYGCQSEVDAAHAIRERCGIKSRTELSTNREAGEIFTADRERFLAWLQLVDA